MIKVMIIDDEPQITAMLEKWFSKNKDWSVSVFNNPELAVHSISTIKPDAVLLDIMMPQMDGLACLTKIKSAEPTTAVVMMTAYSTLDRVLESHKLGADSYVLKPFESLGDVEDKIRKALHK